MPMLSFDAKTLTGNIEIGVAQGLGFAIIYVLIVHLIAAKLIK
jgi:hypothetical protein